MWELLQIRRRLVANMQKKLFEQELVLAVEEKRWAEDVSCAADVCGLCVACEKHQMRMDFENFSSTSGMIPAAPHGSVYRS